jgi:hypothetical protein
MVKRKRKPAGPITSMIRSGKTDKEIMAKLGIKSKATLVKKHYQEMVEAGKVRPIPAATRGRPKKIKTDVKVGKRGTVTVKANLIKMFGFKPGNVFEVKRTKGGILLKKK